MSQESKAYDELNYRNLGDSIFIKLKEEIIDGILKPGQRLQQVELSRKYGVSRAPVRDALRKLEDEGLVTLNRKGLEVTSIDLDELHELFQIREVLEDLAAYKALPLISDENLMALEDLEKKMEKASRKGDLLSWWKFNHSFHYDSYKPCNSPHLLKMINRLWSITRQFRSIRSRLPGYMKCSEKNHRSQLAAIAARDSKLYRSLIKEHLNEHLASIEEVASTF